MDLCTAFLIGAVMLTCSSSEGRGDLKKQTGSLTNSKSKSVVPAGRRIVIRYGTATIKTVVKVTNRTRIAFYYKKKIIESANYFLIR